MAAAGGPQRKAQRSGFALERRSDEMSELCPAGRSEGYAIRDAEDPPANFLQQRLEPERSGAPVWSSQSSRLDFGPTAAAARLRGRSSPLPRLTVIDRSLELGPRKFRGSGGGATMGGDAHRSPPPAAFCLLCRRGQRRSPRRAKPCEAARRVVAPYGRHGLRRSCGHMGPPLLENPQKPLQLFPVLYSNISQKAVFVTIMLQYYGFVTLRPNPLTGGLH